ncbi:leucine-rich repeat domain-containing protein [Marinoscillum furvescens]|nr:T9SS type A sorting domain-containing protein [Marinoscillum furvescens]
MKRLLTLIIAIGICRLGYAQTENAASAQSIGGAAVTGGNFSSHVVVGEQGPSGQVASAGGLKMYTGFMPAAFMTTEADTTAVNEQDKAALVAIYQATGGDTAWIKKEGWLSGSPRFWTGVSISEGGRVVGLELPNNNLVGSLPGELTSLDSLEFLRLGNNMLSGDLPDSIDKLTVLNDLVLKNNQLDGSIPPTIVSLTGLVRIDLSGNQMIGEIPEGMSVLTELRDFQIQDNQFIGFFPQEVAQISTLERLDLSGNQFEGDLPALDLEASALAVLDISSNFFGGTLPETWGKAPSLKEFRLDSNEFEGEIPVEWSGLTSLQLLDLSANSLSGSLGTVSSLPELHALNARGNRFTALGESIGSRMQQLMATYNYLDFGDFEANNSLIQENVIRVNPQDSLFDPVDSLHEVGSPIEIIYAVSGDFNTYRWYKDGELVADQNSNSILINSPDFQHQGTYVLEIRNELYPDIKLYTSGFTLKLSSLERDKEALLAFLGALTEKFTPENWSESNELTSDWEGVTVENNRVTRLELPGTAEKQFIGNVSPRFRELNGIQVLDLSNHQLRSFPDVSKWEGLTSLNISGNRLSFQHIIPNVNIDGITYSPQRRWHVTLNDTLQAGADYLVTVPDLGKGTEYQWNFGPLVPGRPFNNDVSPIEGANSRRYQIEGLDYDQQGTYRVDATHPLVPGLTITSRNRNLWASTDLFGTVYSDETQSLLTAGTVAIYRVTEPPFYLEDTVSVDGFGQYKFEDLVLGDFILLVRPDREVYPLSKAAGATNIVQTYYIKSEFDTAAVKLIVRDRIENVNIEMVNYTVPTPQSNGATFNGVLEEELPADSVGDEESNGRILARRKVKRAGCSMRRFVRRGRMDQEEGTYELYAYVESDDEGRFQFEDVEDGQYKLNIEYPGVPLDEDAAIYFEVGGDKENQLFEISAVVTEEGIQVESNEVLYSLKPYIKEVRLYPNPTDGQLGIDYLVYRKLDNLKIELMDIRGTKLVEMEIPHAMDYHHAELDLTEYESGIYFVNFTDGARSFRHQIKVSRK